jgi:mycothiol synthase
MGLPDGFSFRPPRPGDGEPLLAMLNEESEALIGAPIADLDWLTAPWSDPVARPENDFAVVEDARGNLAGYLMVESEPPHDEVFAIGVVGLAHHGRGIGGAIVDEIRVRAQRFLEVADPGARVLLRMGALAGEQHVSALLTAKGFREVRRFWLMRLDFDGPPQPPGSIPGIHLRPMAEGEHRAVYRCLVDAFRDHWGGGIQPEESWLHRQTSTADYDPSLWFVALSDGEVVGALIAVQEFVEDPRLGYIGELGVLRGYRRRGIARALLQTAFAELHARGCAGAALHVDSESQTGANTLYESAGMTAHPRFAQWQIELRPAEG